MKVPFSWLKEYVDIDVTAQELEEKLFSCGFEVEELIPLDADRKSTRLNSSHYQQSRMPSSA